MSLDEIKRLEARMDRVSLRMDRLEEATDSIKLRLAWATGVGAACTAIGGVALTISLKLLS